MGKEYVLCRDLIQDKGQGDVVVGNVNVQFLRSFSGNLEFIMVQIVCDCDSVSINHTSTNNSHFLELSAVDKAGDEEALKSLIVDLANKVVAGVLLSTNFFYLFRAFELEDVKAK